MNNLFKYTHPSFSSENDEDKISIDLSGVLEPEYDIGGNKVVISKASIEYLSELIVGDMISIIKENLGATSSDKTE